MSKNLSSRRAVLDDRPPPLIPTPASYGFLCQRCDRRFSSHTIRDLCSPCSKAEREAAIAEIHFHNPLARNEHRPRKCCACHGCVEHPIHLCAGRRGQAG